MAADLAKDVAASHRLVAVLEKVLDKRDVKLTADERELSRQLFVAALDLRRALKALQAGKATPANVLLLDAWFLVGNAEGDATPWMLHHKLATSEARRDKKAKRPADPVDAAVAALDRMVKAKGEALVGAWLEVWRDAAVLLAWLMDHAT